MTNNPKKPKYTKDTVFGTKQQVEQAIDRIERERKPKCRDCDSIKVKTDMSGDFWVCEEHDQFKEDRMGVARWPSGNSAAECSNCGLKETNPTLCWCQEARAEVVGFVEAEIKSLRHGEDCCKETHCCCHVRHQEEALSAVLKKVRGDRK